MIEQKIRESIIEALGDIEANPHDIHIEHPSDMEHGDYSSNIALVLSRRIGKNPKELAEDIVSKLLLKKPKEIDAISIAGPGFINFFLSQDFFVSSVVEIIEKGEVYGRGTAKNGVKAIFEYTDPNPFKEFHIGHLMSNTIGESLSRLVEWAGASTKRACYQGDVGLHVAKGIWGMIQLGSEMPSEDDTLEKKVAFLGNAYAYGAQTYEESDSVQTEIQQLNKKIYDRSDEEINNLYDWGREVSLKKFDELYRILGTHFDFFFFESITGPFGKNLVLEHVAKGVFEESDGALIYPGEKEGLHTRVFVNKLGLPTYEAKDLGLAHIKYEVYPYDESYIVTGNEVNDYFKVIISALKKISPELGEKVHHIGHGMLRLPEGKMSSRKGNVITGESLIQDVILDVSEKLKERNLDESLKKEIAESVAVAAIKYSILKQAIGKDIIFNREQALSFEGDSGPYLQYTYVRCISILEKAQQEGLSPQRTNIPQEITTLERLLYRFSGVSNRAMNELAPQYIVVYLTELAGAFNSYYGNTKIIDSDLYAPYRLMITKAVAQVLKNGLWLLGIKTVERM